MVTNVKSGPSEQKKVPFGKSSRVVLGVQVSMYLADVLRTVHLTPVDKVY